VSVEGEPPVATVITVYRGGCEAVYDDRVHDLRLIGRHAHAELALAVGDRVSFDAERAVVIEALPRRTELARIRGRDQRRHVIAANMDRLAIVTSLASPAFRPRLVDRFLLAAAAGGLESVLIVNKIDLAPVPEEAAVYRDVVKTFEVSAETGAGLAPLLHHLADSSTVLAGHSGVGKSSLLNALEPELRLETGTLTSSGKGRHTTTRSIWLRLPGNAVVVDTPGIKEVASGPVDPRLLEEVYPDLASHAEQCRFADCRHDREPECAVRAAVEAGELPALRVESYRKLLDEL